MNYISYDIKSTKTNKFLCIPTSARLLTTMNHNDTTMNFVKMINVIQKV